MQEHKIGCGPNEPAGWLSSLSSALVIGVELKYRAAAQGAL